MYEWRIDLYRSVWCYVEWEWIISTVKQDHICLEKINILDDYIDHLWVKIKWCYKWKWDKVKFKAKVTMYHKNTKVWLTDFNFL